MRLKRIIRIEDTGGIGFYYSSTETDCSDQMQEWTSDSRKRHAMPYDDSKLQKEISERDLPPTSDCGWYYGFATKRQARRWVYKKTWLMELHNAGFVVSEYLCDRDDVAIGDTQSVFLSHESKQSFSILEYFKLNA